MKQLSTNLNMLCNNKNKTQQRARIDKLIFDGKEFITDADISNVLNDYFCNIGANLVKLLPKVDKDYNDYMHYQSKNSMFCKPITACELQDLIKSLDVKKGLGPDNVSSQLVKENCCILINPLVYLYNLSLESGIVPDSLKIAKVILLFKKGDQFLPSNYRPISLLSIFLQIV